jgi:hypothetical protein
MSFLCGCFGVSAIDNQHRGARNAQGRANKIHIDPKGGGISKAWDDTKSPPKQKNMYVLRVACCRVLCIVCCLLLCCLLLVVLLVACCVACCLLCCLLLVVVLRVACCCVVCCLLLCCVLLVVVLRVACCVLRVACCLLLVACCLLLVACCLLLVACCLLLVACCLLLVACLLFLVVALFSFDFLLVFCYVVGWLFAVCCLLFAVCLLIIIRIFMGLDGSGKTTLIHQLIEKKTFIPPPSLVIEQYRIVLNDSPMVITDVPGSASLYFPHPPSSPIPT